MGVGLWVRGGSERVSQELASMKTEAKLIVERVGLAALAREKARFTE